MSGEVPRMLSVEKLELAAFVLKALAHPTRISIVDILRDGGSRSVTEICEILQDKDQPLVSHHLINMKQKGILGSEKKGRFIYYFLAHDEVLTILECMKKCELKLP